tara:strand:- start:66 stop:275 length:210 start_codon:yes stop_codon:yes gene_type:complete
MEKGMTDFTDIKCKSGPFGTAALCPFCKFGHAVKYRDTPAGFQANQAARKVVWDHIKSEHEELIKETLK